MIGRRVLAISVGIASLALALCAQTAEKTNAAKWQAPPEAAAKTNPLTKSPEVLANGHKLYSRSCAGCHDENGSAKTTGASDLRAPTVQEQSDGALFWKISSGNPAQGMPSFTRLPEPQRWQIVLFLRTLKSSASAHTSDKAPSTSPTQNP
jgi:mono/diheme cytochrome c family protein